MMENRVFDYVEALLREVRDTEQEQIEQAASMVADSIMNGGILQAFGAGHSNAGALELTHRAGGFIPSKNIKEPAGGAYESIEGVGTNFMKKVDVRPEDVVVVISNSGRNPLPLEIAMGCKKKGAKIIAVTALEASRALTSRHSSRLRLFEVTDTLLDSKIPLGDSSLDMEGVDAKVCGMSTITTAILLQALTYRAAQIMVSRGYHPPIYKSQNIDGGREYNENLEKKYIDRLYRI